MVARVAVSPGPAATRGNLIPVYREILADGDTPVSAYAKLGRPQHSFLLESVIGGEKWAAYSFIGVAPRAVQSCRAGTATMVRYDVDGDGSESKTSWEVSDPTAALVKVMSEWKPVASPGLPTK